MTYLTYEDLVRFQKEKETTRFSTFTDEELDAMESAFCNERLSFLVEEVRRERRCREESRR